MTMRFSLPIGMIAALLLFVVGCTPEKTAENASPAPASGESPAAKGAPAATTDKPEIALIMKSLANEFFLTMQQGAEAHQKAHADQYSLVVNGIKDESDVARQQQLVEQMIAQQVKAIVIAPADSQALVAVCKKAIDAGIPVINIDNRFDAAVVKERGANIPFVGPDNRKGARLAAEYLATKLKAGDKVAILEGIPSAYNGIQRKLGFEDAIKAAHLNVVASQSANWETDQASKIAAAILTDQPDLKAILCANDSMALGAVSAIKAAGKEGKVLVIGFDSITAAQDLVKQGKMLCTVAQYADKLAVFGIEYALEMLKNKSAPADKETPVDLVTAETAK